MFKFVVPFPQQSRIGGRDQRPGDAYVAYVKQKRGNSLLGYLNKHKDKDSSPYKSKGCQSVKPRNQEINLSRIPPSKPQRGASTTKTNTDLFEGRNVVTLEENEGVKNPQHSVNVQRAAGKGELAHSARQPSRPAEKDDVQNRSQATAAGSGINSVRKKGSGIPREQDVRRAKNKPRPKSAGDEIVSRRGSKRGRMTHDCYSMSDSESDTTWLDQPSPILLTSSPPQSALKVPATKWRKSPYANGWDGNDDAEYGTDELDENSNILGKTKRNSGESLQRDIQQEASDLFCSSLRNNEKYVKSVPETNHVQDRIQSQEQHPFFSQMQGYCETERPSPNHNGVRLGENGHSRRPISGEIFQGGPLFFTDDGCDEDYNENTPLDEITMASSGTEQTITESSYPIPNYNGPLCHPSGGRTFHNHIGLSRVGDKETINGNARYYNPFSKEIPKYEDLIGVNEALEKRQKHKINSSEYTTPNEICENNRDGVERYRDGETVLNGKAALVKSNGYFAMNQNGFNVGNSVSKHLRRPSSGRTRNSIKHRTSDDEDDDATTVSMLTTSDGEEELSSSSSDSTACESIESAKLSNYKLNKIPHHAENSDHADTFVIEKVEHVSGNSGEGDGYIGVHSPEGRRATLQRSISTQSGKLRERLNAVTDDENYLYEATSRGSSQYFDRSVRNLEVEYSGSELDMPSPCNDPSSEASPSQLTHSRISQLKGQGGSRSSRSLTRLPVRKGLPSQNRRCRSLDRGLMSSFISAMSPSHSDFGGRRSLNYSRRRDSLGSDSEVSFNSSLSRRSKLRKVPSSNSLIDRYKPKIDVAESLSALILNPIKGGDNDRKTLSEYLKRSSWNSSKERMGVSAEELRWGKTKFGLTSSPGCRKSLQSEPGASSGAQTPNQRMELRDLDQNVSTISRTSDSSRLRESKVISRSYTPDRYPAVRSSPRSISALLPSPRRNIEGEQEVITILDNEITSTVTVEHDQVARRNSFIEAVTGSSSENAHSTNSELSGTADGDEVEEALNDLANAAEEASSRNSTMTTSVSQHQMEDIPLVGCENDCEDGEIFPDEVNVNLTTDPISNDLAVAVIRRPSLRSCNTSGHAGRMISGVPPFGFHPNAQVKFQPKTAFSRSEPVYAKLHQPAGQANDSSVDFVTVKCRNPGCRMEMCLEDAKAKFKSCHHCYTYYCSQQCRQGHWEKHKMKCVFARVNSDCKKILRMGRENDVIKQAFTRVARTGYLSRGRGCVQVIFSCPEKAEKFISDGLFALESLPLYRTVHDLIELKKRLIENSELITDPLIEMCDVAYDAEKTYVLQVLIDIPDDTLAQYGRSYRNQNSHGVYIHTINPLYKSDYERNSTRLPQDAPETLILTPPTTIPEKWLTASPSGMSYSTSTSSGSLTSSPLNSRATSSGDASRDAKRARQLCFINIQRKLREKGVTLRHQYPDVYRKLCAYVDTGAHFTPVVIYPQDSRTGKNFMCLVMPGSEPQILGWVQTPGLLDDIATG